MSPDNDFDLLLAYLGDELDDEEVGALVERLQNEPDLAEQLVVLAGEEGKIAEWAGAMNRPTPPADPQGDQPPTAPPTASFPSFGSPVQLAVLVLVVAAVIGISVWLANRNQVPDVPIAQVPEPVFDARLVRSTGCRWAEGQAPRVDGGELDIGSALELLEGIAEIEYASGACVVIEGPSTYALSAADAGELTAGQLSATVPKSAIGFTIHTRSLDVVDRGTQFGVRVGEAGQTEVHVFQGEVEAVTRGGDEAPKVRQTLSATQAARFNARGHFDGWLEPDDQAFEGVERHAPGVVSTDRAMRWLPQPPPSLEEGALQSANDMFLFLERQDVVLPRDVQITTLQRRGSQAHFGTEQVTLPAGTRVNSYLLHFDPGASTESRQGGVRFERPVVGLIARGDQLRATDDLFAAPGTRYAFNHGAESGLDNARDDDYPDVVLYQQETGQSFVLKPDPGTLDQVRILVASEPP